MIQKYHRTYLILLLLSAEMIFTGCNGPIRNSDIPFSGRRAYRDVATQVGFGPRIPGSSAHHQVLEWMKNELIKAGWTVVIQASVTEYHPIQNLVAYRSGDVPRLVLGTHYDSRLIADQDKNIDTDKSVPGANDGASGVAVLLELARTLPIESVPIWLVFFDAEDNGNLPGWDWILGSRAFVDHMTIRPDAVIIVDMIGDENLNIFQEGSSNPELVSSIWNQAAQLGFQEQFIPQIKYTMLDDQTPFLEKGIPAVDIIDFDYLYWHTSADTLDKISPKSLDIVGSTLWAWITAQK